MKKRSFIEEPVDGLKRLRFPPTGYKLFVFVKGELQVEAIPEEGARATILDGNPIGIVGTTDILRTIQVGEEETSLLTFEPTTFKFVLRDGVVTFLSADTTEKHRVIYRLDLNVHRYFVMGERRRTTEIWIPRSAVRKDC